jgi:hypothetical protein
MNCWHCNTELIWGNDHDLDVGYDARGDEFSMVTILSCPKCDSVVEVYYPRKEVEDDNA